MAALASPPTIAPEPSPSSPPAPARPFTLFQAWMVVVLLWGVAFLNNLDRTMVTTMHKSLVGGIPMTDAQFGLLTSVFLWVYGTAIPLGGYLADRRGRKWVIVGSLSAWSATTALTSLVTTFPQLLVMRVLLGLSEACYIPAALALIADHHRGTTRPLAIGIHQTGLTAGMMLGGLGGWLAEKESWNFAFVALGLPGIAYSLLLLFALRDTTGREREAEMTPADAVRPQVRLSDALISLFSNRSYILELAVVAVTGAASWIIIAWLPTYLSEQFALGQGTAGLSATAYLNGAAAIGMIFGGLWTGRWSRSNPRSHILVPVIGLCVAIPCLLLTANTGTFVVAIGGLVGFGIARSFLDVSLIPILCLVSDPRYRATGIGTVSACSCFTGGVMIYVVGLLRDHHAELGTIFTYAAGGFLLGTVLLLKIRLTPPEEAP